MPVDQVVDDFGGEAGFNRGCGEAVFEEAVFAGVLRGTGFAQGGEGTSRFGAVEAGGGALACGE